MEHAGKSVVHLSVVVEMEAYGDQAAAASDLFFSKSREEPSRNLAIISIHVHVQWYNWQDQTEVICKCTDSV